MGTPPEAALKVVMKEHLQKKTGGLAKMNILGISALYHDSAACVVVDVEISGGSTMRAIFQGGRILAQDAAASRS